ncbi:MAG: hypothetical protein MSC31_15285 [Solirubrobacteraceae bacterium MAG38_C4-C5]|nr:hypothetical protein [Candidatus Siliceabacter maunaloa]
MGGAFREGGEASAGEAVAKLAARHGGQDGGVANVAPLVGLGSPGAAGLDHLGAVLGVARLVGRQQGAPTVEQVDESLRRHGEPAPGDPDAIGIDQDRAMVVLVRDDGTGAGGVHSGECP